MLALQGFGGVVAVVQRELVEKKQWLTREEFVEDWAVAQILPGPNVVNMSLMIGDRHFGTGGALAALSGMLFFPLIIVLLLVALFSGTSELPRVQQALQGMGAIAAGLITATGLKLMPAIRTNPMGKMACWGLALTTFVAIALLHIPLLWVLLLVGGPASLWAWHCLRRSQALADREKA